MSGGRKIGVSNSQINDVHTLGKEFRLQPIDLLEKIRGKLLQSFRSNKCHSTLRKVVLGVGC
jgi:hypothetical protein